MTKRQYLLQHILHLSSELSANDDPKQQENIREALLFYARELKEHDETQKKQKFIQ